MQNNFFVGLLFLLVLLFWISELLKQFNFWYSQLGK